MKWEKIHSLFRLPSHVWTKKIISQKENKSIEIQHNKKIDISWQKYWREP